MKTKWVEWYNSVLHSLKPRGLRVEPCKSWSIEVHFFLHNLQHYFREENSQNDCRLLKGARACNFKEVAPKAWTIHSAVLQPTEMKSTRKTLLCLVLDYSLLAHILIKIAIAIILQCFHWTANTVTLFHSSSVYLKIVPCQFIYFLSCYFQIFNWRNNIHDN